MALAVERIAHLHAEAAQWPIELAFLENETLEEDSRNEELGLTGRSISEALEKLRADGVKWVRVIPPDDQQLQQPHRGDPLAHGTEGGGADLRLAGRPDR